MQASLASVKCLKPSDKKERDRAKMTFMGEFHSSQLSTEHKGSHLSQNIYDPPRRLEKYSVG